MRSVIVGGGEVATAVCLSQLANGRRTSLRMRDATVLQQLKSHDGAFPAFQPLHTIAVPRSPSVAELDASNPSLSRLQFHTIGADSAIVDPINAIFVCTPLSSFVQPSPSGGSNSSSDHVAVEVAKLLQEHASLQQKQQRAASPLGQSASTDDIVADTSSTNHAPSVVLFTRGLMMDGTSPLSVARSYLHQHQPSQTSAPNLHVALGGFLPREWALDAAKCLQMIDASSGGSSKHETPELLAASRASVASLSFAADASTSLHSCGLVERLFSRESIIPVPTTASVVTTIDGSMAEVYSFMSALELLISFGAGLVSNEYPGNLSATLSFMAHAMEASRKLLCDVFREPHPDLGSSGDALEKFLQVKKQQHSSKCVSSAADSFASSSVLSTVVARAVVNQSAKEFALGRKMKVAFVQREALRSTYGATAKDAQISLGHTVEGVYARMRGKHCKNPFFESIMDAYHTMRRADDVGKQLIRIGWYEKELDSARRDASNSFASHVRRMDEAVDTGLEYDQRRDAFAAAHGHNHPPLAHPDAR